MATRITRMTAANITSLVLPGKFDPNKDVWENYREQLNFALEAAGQIGSVQKRALFLSQCGKEAYGLIVSLLAPKKPSEVAFEEIIVILNKFFIPAPHPILEVDKFYKRKQKDNESITSFVAALHDISSRCDFKDGMQRRIVEQIILGARDNNLKKELLKIKLENLTYNNVVQLALNFESIQKGMQTHILARNHSEVTQTKSVAITSSASVEPMEVNTIDNSRTSKSERCVHCAKNHGNALCRMRNVTCYKCHNKGHTKAACKSNTSNRKPRVNKCSECSTSENNDKSEDNFGLQERVDEVGENGAKEEKPSKPIMVAVKINGVPLKMEVDSGSARSIIPHCVFQQFAKAFPTELLPFPNKLVTWTNSELKTKGQTTVNVEFGNKCVKLPLIVSCGRGPPLLGRTWFEPLGISVQGVKIHAVDEKTAEDFPARFPELFESKIDKYKGPPVHIDCKEDATPVFLRPRTVPFPLRDEVNKELNRMIEDGILTPVKHSRWATPLTIVPKPDGSLRLCGDYRKTVNTMCVTESYPLPTSNEAFFQLSGGKWFSKIDLKHAYNQLKVDEATAELLTLNTPLGLMKMNRLAYGVNAATAIFQRLMMSILAGIDGVACLLDDIAICGYSLNQHNERVVEVLRRLNDIGLKVNKSKCVFTTNKVKFLGFEIDENGVHPSPEKIQEIANKPEPKDKRSLKAFLGLYNFYERFLKEKAVVLEPLYTLLRDDIPWNWGEKQQVAFNKAKCLLTSNLTLTHYSLEKDLHMICDASEYGVGAVLVHKMEDGTEKPIIMSSRTLQAHERRYAQLDKEALAIMFGLKKFRQYLLGRKFVIFTDHKPLLGILGRGKSIPELVSSRMLRWALTMNTFDYELKYRPGSQMGDADSLSRWPTPCAEEEKEQEEVMLIEQMDIDLGPDTIAKETEKDIILKKVKFFILNGWPNEIDIPEVLPYFRKRESLSLNKECIMWSNRVVIPAKLQESVLKALHQGHSGTVQTKMLARGYLWYPSLDKDIERVVAECEACQMGRNNPPVTEHEWKPENRPWSRVHIDFMGPFMGKTFLVIVDSYSKWPIIEIVPSMSSKAVIELLKKAIADNGLPDVIVSDNGLAFTSSECQEFFKRNRIQHITGAPYHPATNGQAERTIQTIKAKLKKQSPLPWADRVAKILFHMRTVPSTVSGKTPAELLNGRKFKTLISSLHPDTEIKTDNEGRKDDGQNKKRFNVGDYVLMRIYNMSQKWQRGRIVSKQEPAVYEVEIESGARHRRHVDQLLKTRPPNAPGMPENEIDNSEYDYENDDDVIIPPPEEWSEIIGC